MERIARDSVRDHPTVMEVLTAFIREHARDPGPERPGGPLHMPPMRPDIRAAVSVIKRRNTNTILT